MSDGNAIDRLGAGRDVDGIAPPTGVVTTLHELATFDGARVHGALHKLPGSRTVVCLMHPRQQVAHHPLIAYFLRMGASVWTQDTRSPNNDINLVHEQALLDVAAGQVFLRDIGFDSVVVFGHSGGGTLFAYYIEQAALEPQHRIDVTPAGKPIALAGAVMPVPDGALFLAPHPGQGQVLRHCIDPSVFTVDDPLSIIPELDMYDPANGFRSPGVSSAYSDDFLREYRAAQLRRIERIDGIAREYAAEAADARVRFAKTEDPRDRREALAPRVILTYRTDADPRYVDLTLSPNDRPYGSLFGRRPDLTNYGLVGFGRITTADAWLSTWSALATNADFQRCAAGIHIPTMYIEFTGDQAAYTEDADRMFAAIPAEDKTRAAVRGQHFGQALAIGEPTGYASAATLFDEWLAKRYDLR
ncbi:alpha/beta hydrolase [Nocardia sp. FBN12]|uniref:alpha/beta hydrolase n=1 Tax=Nocardia sp. FBN12 TaxID=3419766 RepID=UPI003D04E77E